MLHDASRGKNIFSSRATFAARDACPDGRPALPDADYGAALRAACCSDGDGDPPHYLWGTAAARLLLSHYEQFARAYGPGGGRPRVPTASLLVFVDADEDSLALAALLDAPLSSLLGGIEMHGTAVVLLSSADTAPTGTDGTCWRAPLPARDPPTGHREEPAQNVPVRHRAGGTFGTVDLPSWQSMGAASIPNQLAALTGCSQRWIEGSGRVPVPHRGDAWCRRRPGPGGVRRPFFGEEFCYTGSPYVVQDHFFPVAPDVSLLPLFCRLAEDTQRRQGNASAPLWSVEWGPCVHGRPRAALALEHLRGLWDARTAAVPALAFLNARAAHDYTADEARRSCAACPARREHAAQARAGGAGTRAHDGGAAERGRGAGHGVQPAPHVGGGRDGGGGAAASHGPWICCVRRCRGIGRARRRACRRGTVGVRTNGRTRRRTTRSGRNRSI